MNPEFALFQVDVWLLPSSLSLSALVSLSHFLWQPKFDECSVEMYVRTYRWYSMGHLLYGINNNVTVQHSAVTLNGSS